MVIIAGRSDAKAYRIWERHPVDAGDFAKTDAEDDNDASLVTQIRNIAAPAAGPRRWNSWSPLRSIQRNVYNDSFRLSS